MKEERDNFSKPVTETLKKRAAFICSDPNCRKMTIAPSVADENQVQYIGVCAHITAAISGGPRYDINLSKEEREAISNGIFLCNSCSVKIDKNKGIDYSVETLKKWKKDHEEWVLQQLNKTVSSNTDTINMANSTNQYGGITANVVNIHSSGPDDDQKKKEHDKILFHTGEEILNEKSLVQIIDRLLGDESIQYNNVDKIEDIIRLFKLTSNTFLNNDIETEKIEFLEKLNALNSFFGEEFDMFPYNQTGENFNICMNPKVNGDRAGDFSPESDAEHFRLKAILREKCNALTQAYLEYRNAIKKNLYI